MTGEYGNRTIMGKRVTLREWRRKIVEIIEKNGDSRAREVAQELGPEWDSPINSQVVGMQMRYLAQKRRIVLLERGLYGPKVVPVKKEISEEAKKPAPKRAEDLLSDEAEQGPADQQVTGREEMDTFDEAEPAKVVQLGEKLEQMNAAIDQIRVLISETATKLDCDRLERASVEKKLAAVENLVRCALGETGMIRKALAEHFPAKASKPTTDAPQSAEANGGQHTPPTPTPRRSRFL